MINNDRFLSNTIGITLLDSIFDVLTINGNLYWKHGRIDSMSKRIKSFLENNSSLINRFNLEKIIKLKMRSC